MLEQMDLLGGDTTLTSVKFWPCAGFYTHFDCWHLLMQNRDHQNELSRQLCTILRGSGRRVEGEFRGSADSPKQSEH
jgi:hypothetical protein